MDKKPSDIRHRKQFAASIVMLGISAVLLIWLGKQIWDLHRIEPVEVLYEMDEPQVSELPEHSIVPSMEADIQETDTQEEQLQAEDTQQDETVKTFTMD